MRLLSLGIILFLYSCGPGCPQTESRGKAEPDKPNEQPLTGQKKPEILDDIAESPTLDEASKKRLKALLSQLEEEPDKSKAKKLLEKAIEDPSVKKLGKAAGKKLLEFLTDTVSKKKTKSEQPLALPAPEKPKELLAPKEPLALPAPPDWKPESSFKVPEGLMSEKDAQLPPVVYRRIAIQNSKTTVAQRNKIIPAVRKAIEDYPLSQTERDKAILNAIRANGNDTYFFATIKRAVNLAKPIVQDTNFVGKLLTREQGSDEMFAETNQPRYFIVQVTKTKSPKQVKIGELLYLHSNSWPSDLLNYGDTIYFNKVSNKPLIYKPWIKDPKDDDENKLKVIQSNISGFTR